MGISQSNDVTSGISTSSSPVLLLPGPCRQWAPSAFLHEQFAATVPGRCPSAAFLLVVQLCVWLHENTSCLNESSTPIDPDGIVLETCPL